MPKVKFQFYLGQYILLQLSVLKGPCLDFVNHQNQTAELTNDKRQNDKRQTTKRQTTIDPKREPSETLAQLFKTFNLQIFRNTLLLLHYIQMC
jgi:hypothetical protein